MNASPAGARVKLDYRRSMARRRSSHGRWPTSKSSTFWRSFRTRVETGRARPKFWASAGRACAQKCSGSAWLKPETTARVPLAKIARSCGIGLGGRGGRRGRGPLRLLKIRCPPDLCLGLDHGDLGGELQFNHHAEAAVHLEEQRGFLVRDDLLKLRDVFQPELSTVPVERDPALDEIVGLRI